MKVIPLSDPSSTRGYRMKKQGEYAKNLDASAKMDSSEKSQMSGGKTRRRKYCCILLSLLVVLFILVAAAFGLKYLEPLQLIFFGGAEDEALYGLIEEPEADGHIFGKFVRVVEPFLNCWAR